MRHLAFLFVIAIGLAADYALTADGPKKDKDGLPIAAKLLDPAQLDLTGIYTVSGTMGPKKYEGLAAIRRIGPIYAVKYLLPEIADGLAFQPEPDRFVVSWAVQTPKGQALGCNFYKVHPGPRLEGKWTSGPSGINTETMTFLRPFPKEPDDE